MNANKKITQRDLARARNRVKKWIRTFNDSPVPTAHLGDDSDKVFDEIRERRYERAMALIAYHKIANS